MSITYTKLFSSITESTIWVEPYPTRIVWVSMLAMADRKGRIWSSVPGLARRSGVTLEECEAALARFQSPDKYSRTPDNEGRRIEPIDGGWRLLNHEKYREMRDEEARREYKRNWDRENRRRPTQSDKSDKNGPQPTQADADTDAVVHTAGKRRKRSPKTPLPEGFGISHRVAEWAKSHGYDRLEERLEVFVSKCRAKGYTYVDWDEGFMGAIRDDWAAPRKPARAEPRDQFAGVL